MLTYQQHMLESTADQYLLEACLSLADAASLGDLERSLDHWLHQLYALQAWRVLWPNEGTDALQVELHGGADAEPLFRDRVSATMTLTLQSSTHLRGTLELWYSENNPQTVNIEQGLQQLTRVLGNRISRIHLELKSLAQNAELFFVRTLLNDHQHPNQGQALDELAGLLLTHLNVSAFQVLIDQQQAGGLGWGVSSRRQDLKLSISERQRLLALVTVSMADVDEHVDTYRIVQRQELRAVEKKHDLPYLAHLQSLLVMPIRRDSAMLGMVIVGEQRRWDRQPISRHTITICNIIARAVAAALTQGRLMARMIERVQSMQALIDGLNEAVVTTRGGAIVSWNRAAQHLFGYRLDEVVGRPLSHVLPGAPAELRDGSQIASLLAQGPTEIPWTMETTGGRSFDLSCTLTQLPLSESGAPTIMVVFRDMGQEQEIEHLKEELLSSVSHELKTPLNGIYNFSRLLLDRQHLSESMRREIREELESSLDRMTRLTNDFMDVARARRHRLPLELEAVDVRPLVRATVREQQRRYPHYRLALRMQKTLASVRGDRMRIRQVLDNLISNAVKYSTEGSAINIYIRQQGDMVAISVSDHGLGIPKPLQARIFEPFYRATSTRSRHVPGVGLGLSIVKSLVQAHGGEITLHSRPGRGSRFTVTLPVMPTTVTDDQAEH